MSVVFSCKKFEETLVSIPIPRMLLDNDPPKFRKYIELLKCREINCNNSKNCCCDEYVSFHPDFNGEFVFYEGYFNSQDLRDFCNFCESYEKRNEISKIRSKRIKEAKGSHNLEDLKRIAKWQQYRCYFCFKKLEVEKLIQQGARIDSVAHWDHLTPISRGGSEYPSNMALTCIKCNLKKGSKTEKQYWKYLDGIISEGEISEYKLFHLTYRKEKIYLGKRKT